MNHASMEVKPWHLIAMYSKPGVLILVVKILQIVRDSSNLN